MVEQQLLDTGEPARTEAHPARRVAPRDAVGGLARWVKMLGVGRGGRGGEGGVNEPFLNDESEDECN
jgi:hypothetical protein